MGRKKHGSGKAGSSSAKTRKTRDRGGWAVRDRIRKDEGGCEGATEEHAAATAIEREEVFRGKEIRRRDRGEEEEEEAEVVGVGSRLNFPLVLAEDGSSSEEEEESVELTIRPRLVFASRLCAVCMDISRVVCERCRMVSYCSRMHRTEGAPKHRELCEALAEIHRCVVGSSLSEGSREEPLDAERYRVYRLRLLGALESAVGRPLDLWEKEIVLYPSVCRVCRRFRERTVTCTACGMETFCEDHAAEHEKWCPEFRVFQRCLFLQQRHGMVEPRIPNAREIRPISELAEPPRLAFDRLMHRIFNGSAYYRRMDCYTYSTLSHMTTIPLTALHSMQTCCPDWRDRTDWTIHLLGAEFQFEGVNLRVWEKFFLHFLPNLKRLRVTLIGPELRLPSAVPPALLSRVPLCAECKSTDRAVDVLFRPEQLYHEFVRGRPREPDRSIEPDLVCAFNPGLYRNTGFAGKDTWFETIREFAKITAPIAITSYTVDEMRWEIARVTSVIGDIEILSGPQRNPFASIKPDRNFVSDETAPLIYKNYYLTIFKGKFCSPRS